jgi:Na+/proline symporter
MLSPQIILIAIASYFIVLTAISYLTGKEDNNEVFFNAKRSSNWAVVAFGMVGASLSGVTFISVPGWVGESQFTYFQVVIGYLIGYLIVANLLLPLYYRMGLTSIYEYLFTRFGKNSHYVGSISFLISRILGASFRLFLVAIVLQQFIFDDLGIPFEITVIISILLIWLYTRRGGIKTIVWTDTIQTTLMILAVILSIYYINQDLGWTFSEFISSSDFKEFDKIFVTESITERSYFLKSIIGGAFITICMTGLDQDMMQKNLTCKNIQEAKKNMIVFSFILTIVTFLFIVLGALLFIYASKNNITVPLVDNTPRTDLLFPQIALRSGLRRVFRNHFYIRSNCSSIQ